MAAAARSWSPSRSSARTSTTTTSCSHQAAAAPRARPRRRARVMAGLEGPRADPEPRRLPAARPAPAAGSGWRGGRQPASAVRAGRLWDAAGDGGSSAACPSASRRSSTSTRVGRRDRGHHRARLRRRDAERAAAEFFGPYRDVMSRIGASAAGRRDPRAVRGRALRRAGTSSWARPTRFAAKILSPPRDLRPHDRYLAQIPVGAVPHEQVLRSIELFATEVAPRVREALA